MHQIGDIESEYTATGDVRSAMRQLEALARSASPQSASTTAATATTAATTATTTARSQPSSRSRSQSPVPASATERGGAAGEVLSRVILDLVHQKMLSIGEAELLVELVGNAAPMIVAAMEVFAEDGDEAELADTLARVARFGMKQRLTAARAANAKTSPPQ
eukprot:9102-Heterococcus_DN1.PRE.2